MREIIDPSSDTGWARLALGGSLFASPPWIRALVSAYGFEVRASIERSGDELVAGIPFALVEDAAGARVVSLPFSDYCDPLLGQEGSWEDLVEPLFRPGHPVSMRVLHETRPLEDARLRQTGQACWHAIDVVPDHEAMWSALRGSARRNIRAAERAGAEVSVRRDIEAVETFHRLHCDLRRHKYGLLAQPLQFFESIWEQFAPSGDIALLVAEADGQVAAVMVFLTWADTMYYKFGASAGDGLSVRPNDLLFWEAMKLASSQELQRIDLGLSDADQDGLIRFKRKFASQEGTLTSLRHVPPGYANAGGEEFRRALGTLTGQLTQELMPAEVSRRAGDVFYRYFC